MPKNLLSQIQAIVVAFADAVDPLVEAGGAARNAAEFRRFENDVAAGCRGLADEITARTLTAVVGDEEFRAATREAARQGGRYRHGGRRRVTVTLLGGSKTRVEADYFKRDRRGRPGRPRKSGRRSTGGSGLYPALAALGIHRGISPATATEICRQVADSDSVRAARSSLDRRGLDLGHKQTLGLVNQMSRRAVRQRATWLRRRLEEPCPTDGPLRNKRVVVATDGGRLRERLPVRRGRPRKNGHRGFKVPWREPKLLTIYVVDENGKMDSRGERPVHDGTLGDCDALFKMLVGYLRALGAHQARELIILGDGAHWIWNRTRDLVERVGIDSTRVTEIIDCYHAAEKLHEVAAIPAGWSESERAAWVGCAKKLLRQGHIGLLLSLLDELARGRRGKAVRKHRPYFADNVHRMQYGSFRRRHLPIGSGAIESTVRRVVNLRMKSNAKFWLEANAEGMLLLRSYLKAGRFDDLLDWSLATAGAWWRPDTITDLLQA